MNEPYFDGWYLINPGEAPIVPWSMIIVPIIMYLIFMAIITGMSRDDSRLKELLQVVNISISPQSSMRYMVIPFSVVMALERSFRFAELDLALIIVSVLSFLFIILVVFEKIKLNYLPYLYGVCIIAISSLPSWHFSTLVFIVPVTAGIILGYIIGIIDSKGKQRIQKAIN